MIKLHNHYEVYLWEQAKAAYQDAIDGRSDNTVLRMGGVEGVDWNVVTVAHSLKEGDANPVILTALGAKNLASRFVPDKPQTGFPPARLERHSVIQDMPRELWAIAIGATSLSPDYLKYLRDTCGADRLSLFGGAVVPGRILPSNSTLNQCRTSTANFSLRSAVSAFTQGIPIAAVVTPHAVESTPRGSLTRVARYLFNIISCEGQDGRTVVICPDDRTPEPLNGTNLDMPGVDDKNTLLINADVTRISESGWPIFNQDTYHGPDDTKSKSYAEAFRASHADSMSKPQALEYLRSLY